MQGTGRLGNVESSGGSGDSGGSSSATIVVVQHTENTSYIRRPGAAVSRTRAELVSAVASKPVNLVAERSLREVILVAPEP